MKKKGVYYIPSADKIWVVDKVEYYEDIFNPEFSIVSVWVEGGFYPKTLITKDQFSRFVFIGDL